MRNSSVRILAFPDMPDQRSQQLCALCCAPAALMLKLCAHDVPMHDGVQGKHAKHFCLLLHFD